MKRSLLETLLFLKEQAALGRLGAGTELGCTYTDSSNKRCGIGALLPDEKISEIVRKDCNEGTSVGDFYAKGFEVSGIPKILKDQGVDSLMAERIQSTHDENFNEDFDKAEFIIDINVIINELQKKERK